MPKIPPDALGDATRVQWVADEFFSTVRRLFSGTPQQALSELFQNSARAGASDVAITFRPAPTTAPTTEVVTFVYQDNGPGLQGGVAGVLDLLRLGVSDYDAEVLRNQHPMGVGFYSLLAVTGVTAVVIESNDIRFSLDVADWWSSAAYRDAWLHQYRDTATSAVVAYAPGFRILVTCTPEAERQFRAQLPQHIPDRWDRVRPDGVYPAEGYAGRLRVTVDGDPIATEVRPTLALAHEHLLSEFSYQGNRVRVTTHTRISSTPDLVTVWYGQPIVSADAGNIVPTGFAVVLDVTQGQPVTPRSPAREGLVRDAAAHQFGQWIRATLKQWYGDVTNEARVTPAVVVAMRHLDHDWFERDSPYALLARWRTMDEYDTTVSIDDVSDTDGVDEEVVVRRDRLGAYLLVDDVITLRLPAPTTPWPAYAPEWVRALSVADFPDGYTLIRWEHGLASLLAAARLTAYRALAPRVTHLTLYWQPGSAGDGLWTVLPGVYGLGQARLLPTQWTALPPDALVYLLDAESVGDHDLADSRFFVAAPDLGAFLARYAHVLWRRDDDCCDDVCDEVFDASVDDFLRQRYHPTAISLETTLQWVWRQAGVRGSPIHYFELVYDQSAPGPQDRPIAIRVTAFDGTTTEFTIWR
ncbi:MAG TPA: hypothetical protein VMV29_23375 [Ktedonobacterales bacterium]|nr:hypothetical protein [Ktedonobacterales bacterium]